MTMENFEQKYKEALENFKKIKSANSDNKELVNFIEYEYPELRESEDDKIRKELVEFVNQYGDKFYGQISKACAISWLEKQGEQKPTDKIEPKFKIGDWVVYNRDDYSREIMQIYDIRDCRYCFNDNIHFSWSIKECDEKSHLWTIQDANDGDVLATKKGNPFIYDKDRYNNGLAYYYAGLDVNKELTLKSPHHMLAHFGELHSVSPATKEQRELLFQKMKEAGYKWDAENKKLNKIEQSPIWSEEDENFYKSVINGLQTYNHSDTPCSNWFKSLKDRVQHQPKQEWSEYDEIQLSEAIQMIEANGTWIRSEDAVKKVSNWLNSLKPQTKQDWNDNDKRVLKALITLCDQKLNNCDSQLEFMMYSDWMNWLKSLKPCWKPSEFQLECLAKVIPHRDNEIDNELEYVLTELYEQLKQL